MYLQDNGVAMGSNASAPLSDLYLCEQEIELLSSAEMLYWRFRDDVLCLCSPATMQKRLLPFTRNISPMTLIWEPAADTQVYLDVRLTLDRRTQRVNFQTYRKALNQYLYIPPFSAHPRHVFVAWIHAELNRLHRTNSTMEALLSSIQVLKSNLKRRGYGATIFEKALQAFLAKYPVYMPLLGPATPVKLKPLVGDDGMPKASPPPFVAVLPHAPRATALLEQRVKQTVNELQQQYPALPMPITAYTTGAKLSSTLFDKSRY